MAHPSRWKLVSLIKDRFLLHSVMSESGGMGLVYKAKDLLKEEAQDRNPWVAIKVLNDDFKKHPEALRALQRSHVIRKIYRIRTSLPCLTLIVMAATST